MNFILEFLVDLITLILKVNWYFLEVVFQLIISPPRKSVEGQVVLVTGAGHGIGRVMARKFAEQKARVVIWDINEAGQFSLNNLTVNWFQLKSLNGSSMDMN